MDVDDSIFDKDDYLYGGMEDDPYWDNMKNDRLCNDGDEEFWDDEDDYLWEDEDDDTFWADDDDD